VLSDALRRLPEIARICVVCNAGSVGEWFVCW
jgi:hypothetical protein